MKVTGMHFVGRRRTGFAMSSLLSTFTFSFEHASGTCGRLCRSVPARTTVTGIAQSQVCIKIVVCAIAAAELLAQIRLIFRHLWPLIVFRMALLIGCSGLRGTCGNALRIRRLEGLHLCHELPTFSSLR